MIALLLLACTSGEPTAPIGDAGGSPMIVAFPFEQHEGHCAGGQCWTDDPDGHSGRTPHRNWDIDCAFGDGVGSAIDGVVSRALDGLPNGEAYGYGNQVCVRDSHGIEVCHNHLDAGTITVNEGTAVASGMLIGGCGNSGYVVPGPGGDGTHLDVYAQDAFGGNLELADPGLWSPLADLAAPPLSDTGLAPSEDTGEYSDADSGGEDTGRGDSSHCDGGDEDGPECFTAVYRFVDSTTGARCWSLGTSPPASCASYTLEIEAWLQPAEAVPGTTKFRQCSRLTDHILVPDGSPDQNSLQSAGYDCDLVLGYLFDIGGAPRNNPIGGACDLWRFAFDTPGGGAHLFTRGADDVDDMTCEPPIRAEVLSPHPCFDEVPVGC